MDDLLLDLRFGLRSLLKSPGTTCAALATLALGIGATTAVYSILNHVILHPLPFKGEDRLVLLNEFEPGPNIHMTPPGPVLEQLRATTTAFDAVEMIGYRSMQSRPPDPAIVKVGFMPPDLLSTLGLAPVLGRPFLRAEESPGSPPVLMLGYGYWQQEFGGRSDIVGRTVTLNDTAFTIVGVTPRALDYLTDFSTNDAWAPYQTGPSGSSSGDVGLSLAMARLRPGATLERGRQDFQRAYKSTYPGDPSLLTWHLEVTRPGAFLGTAIRSAIIIIVGAVALVLVIACANVAGLLLVRGISREHELSVRATLGASRGRLVRQLFVEHALLGLLGGLLALPVAQEVLHGVRAWHAGQLAVLGLVTVDGSALRAALLVTLSAVALFGVLPAIRATRTRSPDALKGRGATATGSRARFHYSLVTGEVALAVVIVVAATLLVKGYRRLLESDPGFKAAGLVGAYVKLPATRYPNDAGRAELWRQLVARVTGLPGVRGATTAGYLPPNFGLMPGYRIEVTGSDPSEAVRATPFTLGSEPASYFSVLQIPIIEGRSFTPDEERDGSQTIVINEAMARSLWPGTSAVGQHFRMRPRDPWQTVVGVCGDIAERGLLGGKGADWFAYEPPNPMHVPRWRWIVARVADPEQGRVVAAQLTPLVHSLDENVVVTQVASATELLEGSLALPRFSMALVAAFGFLALLLAAVGLYGVLSYAVQQRTREIGIRIALGAEGRGVVRLAVGRGIRATGLGFALGLVGSVAAFRVMRSALYGMSPWDPVAFFVVIGLLGVVALAAAWLPARRAARVDPMVALRYE